MYSTLLFLDKPRHLRYDIQAILDLDQLLPGGFKTIFAMGANLDALRIIFWAGLKHEDNVITFDQVEEYLKEGIAAGWTLEKLVEIFAHTLWEQGWLSKSQEKSKEPVTVENTISQMEEINYKRIHLTPREFYAITPQEFIKMTDFWNEYEDRQTALICATICNANGATKPGKLPFEIEDFMPKKKLITGKKQTAEQMRSILTGAWG
jgi:hypothetical protein